jgi:CPA2 family monovalent cation:H+ antiporter-2
LTGGLTAAVILGFVTQKLRLSPIVGYLLAGVAVGPFTPGFVAHTGLAEQLAEIGVILLMFGVGLHFHVRELIAVRKVALPGAAVQIAVSAALGALAARAVGWNLGAGVVYGLSISVASTVVLLRVLADRDALHTPAGHVAVGWLIVEDLFTVLVLVLLPVAAKAGAADAGDFAVAIGKAVLKIAALVVFTLVVGARVIPALLGYVAKTRSRELFTLTVLVIALGIAVGSAKLFGTSMALGAFLAGMVVGQSNFAARAASEALPLRDAFAVLFFVSVGMLFDPTKLGADLPLTLATLAIVLLGKPVAAFVVVRLLRHPVKTALAVAVALSQIGEFSFMLAALGRQLGIVPESATQSLVATAIISITLNPLIFRWVEPLAQKWAASQAAAELEAPAEPHADAEGRAVVVGYGVVGKTLTELLRENHVEATVVELNHDTVKTLKEQDVRAVYGDASQREVLESAGIHEASSLIFAGSGSPGPSIEMARELNPDLVVIARSTYLSESNTLADAGADVVVSSEGEVALAMAEVVLSSLGATPEQLDRARERVRANLVEAA